MALASCSKRVARGRRPGRRRRRPAHQPGWCGRDRRPGSRRSGRRCGHDGRQRGFGGHDGHRGRGRHDDGQRGDDRHRGRGRDDGRRGDQRHRGRRWPRRQRHRRRGPWRRWRFRRGYGRPGAARAGRRFASNRFVAYDRHGQVVHDYASHLDFGSGFTSPSVELDSGPRAGRDARASRHLMVAQSTRPAPRSCGCRHRRPAGGRAQRRGRVGRARAVAEEWLPLREPERLRLGRPVAVFRAADGQPRLAGRPIAQIMFPRDGEPLVYVPYDRVTPVRLVDLVTGTDIAPPSRNRCSPSSPASGSPWSRAPPRGW